MRHRLTFLFQLFLLILVEIGICQFVKLELQEILILPIALYILSESLEFFLGRQILLIGLLVSLEFVGITRNDIHHTQLEILLVQQEILMLGMDIDQLVAEFL